MASVSSLQLSPPNLLHNPTKRLTLPPKLHLQTHFQNLPKLTPLPLILTHKRSQTLLFAVAEETQVASVDPSSVAARRLYVGNIPRTVDNAELTRIVEEHGAVEKAEVFCLWKIVSQFWSFSVMDGVVVLFWLLGYWKG